MCGMHTPTRRGTMTDNTPTERLIKAAWDHGLMHCDNPAQIVYRVLRELATIVGEPKDDVPVISAGELERLAEDVEGWATYD